MKATVSNLTAASLIAVGGAGYLGWSAGVAEAQSACVEQCRSQDWAGSQCRRYCETRYGEPRRGPRVYGFTSRSSGGCGQYRYLRDGACVDARIDPPGRY